MSEEKDSAQLSAEDAKLVGKKRWVLHEYEGHGEFLFVQPSRAEHSRLVKNIQDENVDNVAAMAAYVKNCVVRPSADRVDALFEDGPGLIDQLCALVQDLAKPALKAVVKKG
jgi:hypothetical protein